MPTTRYFDRAGQLVSRPAWETLSGRCGYGHVALDAVVVAGTGVQVHTFWTGMTSDDTGSHGRPLIFRTMVHGLRRGLLTWGWTDVRAAAAGHTAVLSWVLGDGPIPMPQPSPRSAGTVLPVRPVPPCDAPREDAGIAGQVTNRHGILKQRRCES
ncbi:hypothetical protein [Frankia sp. QA3]|uniref:hypothetical protein n=1 Tax=Frankia sp. QA3 TaxID=710111 RepID=UPI000269BC02|nr:hypothetical protein [Frankia sp. QA3]EIV92657.1 hypothetical protein FraQA3DRAFT_2253 [Frankia sp. QA3]